MTLIRNNEIMVIERVDQLEFNIIHKLAVELMPDWEQVGKFIKIKLIKLLFIN